MSQRTVFVSNSSFDDASQKAKLAGYNPVGQARRPNGQFIIFAERRFNFGM